MKINSSIIAALFVLSLSATPVQARADCVIGAWLVTAVAGGATVLMLIPFSVAIAQGPYAWEQYCPGNAGAFCCTPPNANPTTTGSTTTTTQAPNATTTPSSTTVATTTPTPSDCVYQSLNFGTCGGGKTLYCPGQNWPAPSRLQSWVNPVMIAFATFLGITGTVTAISFLVASIGTCSEMC